MDKASHGLRLLCFLVKRVFAAELAVLVHFESVGIVFLVFGRVIIPLLAFRAGESDLNAHFGTSYLYLKPKKASV